MQSYLEPKASSPLLLIPLFFFFLNLLPLPWKPWLLSALIPRIPGR